MKTYVEVADKFNLKGLTRERYLKYMNLRWQDTEEVKCLTGYASEWAIRFSEGVEEICSDMQGKRILQEIN